MAIHIINEANRCLKCKNPLCQKGCPIHTPIPQITQLFCENKLMEAGKILFENNPMSVVCSTVCNHEQQCQGNCVLGRKGNPIHFCSIENFVSDAYLDRMEFPDIQQKEEKVAVIGAGPAGLTDRAEYYIVKNGGHGSREFWQDSVKELMIEFFDKHLK